MKFKYVINTLAVIVSLIIGINFGYWYGRTVQMWADSAPKNITFEQWHETMMELTKRKK